jgi:hypothetical protein
MVSPLLGRALVSLGFSVVTITGVNVVMDTIKAQLVTHLQSVPAAALQLAMLGGVGTALGMIFGAIATKLAIWQIQNATKILGVNS